MSKAYGICGLRIGYLLTANSDFAAAVRKGIHIWNINGFAEEFLRILPQYKQEFEDSCEKVKADRDVFYTMLCSIEGMIVFKPDANYIYCRLPEGAIGGPEVTKRLFIEYNIYIYILRIVLVKPNPMPIDIFALPVGLERKTTFLLMPCWIF